MSLMNNFSWCRHFQWHHHRPWLVWLAHGALVSPAAAVLIISCIVRSDRIESGAIRLGPECFMQQMIGRNCPGCGMTRAFCSVSHGEFRTAYRYNPLILVYYPAAVLALVGGLFSFVWYLKTKGAPPYVA
jgi:hypothetical protein